MLKFVAGIVGRLHHKLDDMVQHKVHTIAKLLGQPTDLSYVKYFLHYSQNMGYSYTIVHPFYPERIADTKGWIFFLIHGWTQNRTACPWFKPLTELLLKKFPESHVVQVDWGKLAAYRYTHAAFLTEAIGHRIAISIQILVNKNNFPLGNIVIIGHSLGGQVAGWTGKWFYKHTKKKLSRIIALDPASPIFTVRPEAKRLNKNDADVVMVIHTDTINFGYPTNCGTIDFYPNGPNVQPGCRDVGKINVSAATDSAWCSHRRAHDFFIEALKRPGGFIATKCDNFTNYKKQKCDRNTKVSMGDWLTKETGTFFLETAAEPPFIKR
ncbi:endothelial lipase-like [Coccinella septempunctata]|uniref:endothelial lipase-like n=1 Tax=Coccinella septempunctata TaxID=41139 RepID=UPI001D067A26|nr:endothelial lipase-like [Coccinella septempunctata]XP_044745530.1 endothelial lipase-like [Coccinella septempunctata]XP_044745531.1 endothelial lipase-like [Coccinella septempunctata]